VYIEIHDHSSSILDRVSEEFAYKILEAQKEGQTVRKFIAPILQQIQNLAASWRDVGSFTIYGDALYPSLNLYLKRDRRDSTLPREVAVILGVNGKKNQDGDGALSVDYLVPIPDQQFKLALTIGGYLPTTCKVVEEEQYVPGHVAMVKKVVCGPGE
jgi:hypothetical protein